ncbi:MAG: class I SAM-dependent methyltransferase [Actinomycetota bacterium]|nr:class I SAM-dependent methyltransferase [Actinomycetota bacterium]
MTEPWYTSDFYSDIEAGCVRSAEVVVPLVHVAVEPESVIDVGCGTGAWAAAFARHGARVAHGVDGSWVPRERLLIPPGDFYVADIAGTDPLAGLTHRAHYDLAVCLEVAEHLRCDQAATLIGNLVALAPVVLFSAAIPGQGGVGHINEQWLDHWQALFDQHDYQLFDIVRAVLWDDERVEAWYIQNIVLFAGPDADRARLADVERRRGRLPLRLVHPRVFENSIERWSGDRTEEALQ